jgi:hypothetical protein
MVLALAARRSVAVAAATALLTTGGVAGGLLSSPALAAAATVTSATPAVIDNTGSTPITINGGGFTPQYDTVDFIPTFASAVSLPSVKATVDTATSTANALKVTVAGANAAPGAYTIRVVQTLVGGVSPATTTCTKCLTIVGDRANVSGSSYGASTGGTSRGYRALDVKGSGLARGAFVRFYNPDGSLDSKLTFTPGDPNNTATQGYISSSLIRGNYSAAAGYTPGRHVLKVVNTDGGTGTTSDFYQPDFVAGGVSPSSLGQGAQQRTVTITGQGFRPGAYLMIQDLDTSSASDISWGAATVNDAGTTISAPVTVRGDATTGTGRTVTVVGPDGGVLSVSNAFHVNPGPGLTSLNQPALGQGAVQDVTINGSGFATSGGTPTFTFSGTGVSAMTKSNTASSAVVTVAVAANAAVGGRSVTVTNPDGGAATLSPTTDLLGTTTYPFTVDAGPVLKSVSPASAAPTSNPAITVTGQNFDAVNGMTFKVIDPATGAVDPAISVGAVTVTDGGAADDTASFTLTITGAAAGLRTVVGQNKGDFGTASCAGCFGVDSLSVSPVGASNTGSPSLTITGSGFSGSSTVQLVRAGTQSYQAPIPGTSPVVSGGGTQLVADFDLAGVAPGPYNVVVTTGPVTKSCSGCFTVTAAAPTLSTVTPSTGGQGATGRTITLTGTNFWPGETVTVSGTGVDVRNVTVVSTTQITAVLDIAQDAATTARDVTVTNADGVQSATKAGGFTVNAKPTVSGVAPTSLGQGAKAQTVTVSGDGFDDALTPAGVNFGPGVTVTAVSVAQGNGLPGPLATPDTITATVSIAEDAATTKRDVVVTNPDAGSGTLAQSFTVNPGPKVSAVSPLALKPSTTGQAVTISGTGFASNAVPSIAGVTLTAVTVSADGQTITATAATDATKGARDVVVTNPTDHGVGTCAACLYVAVPPGPPTGVSVQQPSPPSTLKVNWTAPVDDGGAPITSYYVSANRLNSNGTTGAVAGTPATVAGDATTGTVTDLTPGVTYRVFVVARNAAGQSPETVATATGTVVGVPTTPVVTAKAGDQRVTVTWTTAAPNGSAVTGYKVAVGSGTPIVVGPSVRSYTFTGLTNGTSYTFKVQATNGYGDSTAGTASATPRFATRLYISRTPGVSTSGQAVTFYGKLTRAGTGAPIVGARVTVALTPDVGKGEQAFPVTDINGVYKYTTKPVYNLTFRAGFSGDADDAGVITLAYRQAVMTKVTVTSPASGGYTSASSPLKVTGTTSPNKAGSTVYLSRYSGGRWITVGKGTVATNGSFVVYGTLPVGDYQLRAGVAAAKGNAAGNSATFVSHRR